VPALEASQYFNLHSFLLLTLVKVVPMGDFDYIGFRIVRARWVIEGAIRLLKELA